MSWEMLLFVEGILLLLPEFLLLRDPSAMKARRIRYRIDSGRKWWSKKCARESGVGAVDLFDGSRWMRRRSSADEGSVEGRKVKVGEEKRRKIVGFPSLS